MKFTPLKIEGAWLIELEKKIDERGFFARAYCEKEFADHQIKFHFSQTNISQSLKAGAIRGLHYQEKPFAEAKLMRCIQGSIYDAMIDLRPESPTYLQAEGVSISASGMEMIFIPAYCAHGYQALEANSTVLYSASSPYTPGVEKGIRWNDVGFTINWPMTDTVIVSDKDANWPPYIKE